MTTPSPYPDYTPYIVPDGNFLQSWPTGVDFTTIPPGTNVSTQQKAAALASVCAAATAQVNGQMNFPLYSVLNTEQLQGPDYRITYRKSTGEGRVILTRWPVTQIASVQVAPSGVYPFQWTVVPAGFYRPEYPIVGHYSSNTPTASGEGGQAILIAPPYVSWANGRWGTVVQVQYYHGWPHTRLAATATPVTSGPQVISVTDCTAWAPFAAGQPGAGGVIYDNLAGQEPVSVTAASVTTGPGTLTLAAPLNYTHPAGVMVSSLPADVIWCTVLFAAAEALTRGGQATTTQAVPGGRAGGSLKETLRAEAIDILHRFKRTL